MIISSHLAGFGTADHQDCRGRDPVSDLPGPHVAISSATLLSNLCNAGMRLAKAKSPGRRRSKANPAKRLPVAGDLRDRIIRGRQYRARDYGSRQGDPALLEGRSSTR
jgi:hypothetical protein